MNKISSDSGKIYHQPLTSFVMERQLWKDFTLQVHWILIASETRFSTIHNQNPESTVYLHVNYVLNSYIFTPRAQNVAIKSSFVYRKWIKMILIWFIDFDMPVQKTLKVVFFNVNSNYLQ